MKRREDILNELKEVSEVVAEVDARNPYTVPEGYFETLPGVIMAKLIAGSDQEQTILSVAGKESPMEVPAGYFENLSSSILAKIKTQEAINEIRELSPLLASVQSINVFTVPDGYFEMLDQQVTSAVVPVKTPVVSLFSRKWTRYAAAAAVISIIAFGTLFLLNKQSTKMDSVVAQGLKIKSEQQFNEELATVDQSEILSYLKMTGEVKDAETISSLVDQSNLPSEVDYMDPEFLDSYMKELETTTNKSN